MNIIVLDSITKTINNMFLYKIERTTDLDYDQCAGAVVVANSPEEAAKIDPLSESIQEYTKEEDYNLVTWVLPKDVKVTLLGNCVLDVEPGTVILKDYLNG